MELKRAIGSNLTICPIAFELLSDTNKNFWSYISAYIVEIFY